jgi:hypothetical protein
MREHTRIEQELETRSNDSNPIKIRANATDFGPQPLHLPKIPPPAFQVFKEFDHE